MNQLNKQLLKKSKLVYTNPNIRGGKLCFVGTRIMVSTVLEYLSKGWSVDDLKSIMPDLNLNLIYGVLRIISKEIQIA